MPERLNHRHDKHTHESVERQSRMPERDDIVSAILLACEKLTAGHAKEPSVADITKAAWHELERRRFSVASDSLKGEIKAVYETLSERDLASHGFRLMNGLPHPIERTIH